MDYGQRVPEGDLAEHRAMELLKRKGFEVIRAPRRDGPWDLKVNDKHTIDVKSAVWTSYKGSDGYPIQGYVFSNMHLNPTSDFYLLLCLSQDRQQILGYYLVPSSELKQRTLTLTKARIERFAPYLSNLEPLTQ
jgi:hypothetical protein